MKKILNKRLEKISAFIEDGESVIDIGCDHGLLGIYLYLNRENMKIVSSDINSGPLTIAKENLLKYHLEDKIELRLGNGLDTITDDINTVVISGMGGITMVNILKKIDNYPNISKLVLSPNNDFSYVREEVNKLGFKIVKEEIVCEHNKYYLVIEYVKGQEKIDYFFGKLDLKNETAKKYYKMLYEKNRHILNNLHSLHHLQKNDLINENIRIKKNVEL